MTPPPDDAGSTRGRGRRIRRTARRPLRPWRREAPTAAPITAPILGDRVELRPFTEDDAAAMLVIYGDPAVMQYVGHGPVSSVEGVRAMLRQYIAHQRTHGFAFWAVLDRASGELIGDAGLARTAGGELEMGYTLAQRAWGRGLGTEVASIWTRVALETLGAPRLRALVEPENARSRRVLEHVGFHRDGETIAFGRPHLVYRIAAEPSDAPSSGDES